MRDLTIIAAAIPAAEVKDGLLVLPASEIEGALAGLQKLGGFMLFDISAVDRPNGSPAPLPAAAAGTTGASAATPDTPAKAAAAPSPTPTPSCRGSIPSFRWTSTCLAARLAPRP